MPDTNVLENKLAGVRALYEEICLDADEDGTRDDEELAIIDRVEKKIAELEAMIDSQPDSGMEGRSPDEKEEDAKEAWLELSSVYAKLLRLHTKLENAFSERADDLDAYLRAISAHVASKDWASAVNQTVLAATWADENNLWDTDQDDPVIADDEDEKNEDEESGKLSWEKMYGDEALVDYEIIRKELEDQGSEHAGTVAEYCEEIKAAVADEDWKTAITRTILLEVYISDNKIDPMEFEYKWGDLREDVATLRELYSAARVQDGLRDEGFPQADALQAFVNKMNAAEEAQNWLEAVDQYRSGKAYADKHDLWNVTGVSPSDDEDDEDEEKDDDAAKRSWENWQFYHEKIRNLYDQLSQIEHPLADKLGATLDKIDEAARKEEYRRATDLLLDDAGKFADDHDLWDAVKSADDDESNLLPRTTRDQIKTLKDLSRELNRMDHEKAGSFAELVVHIHEEVTDFNKIIPTGRAVQKAWAFADAHNLWDAVPPLPKGEEEAIFWETNGKLYRELNALHRKLDEAGHEGAARLGEKLADVDAAIGNDHFHLASIHLSDAKELADDQDLWDEAPLSDDEDDEGGESFHPSTASIAGTVGRGGKNQPDDVMTIQLLLNLKGSSLDTDCYCGPRTIAAIEKFQKESLGWNDGLVDPGGKTFGALTGKATIDDISAKASDVVRNVSGTVTDIAGSLVDAVDDVFDEASRFLGGLFEDDDDEIEKRKKG